MTAERSVVKLLQKPKATGWQGGSSGRAPAEQAESPNFKPQYHQKKKKIHRGWMSASSGKSAC
jgi:hypothetical protein